MIAEFFSKYEELKDKEKWEDIVTLCEETLEKKELSDKDKASIYNKLSNCYYELKDYNKGLKAANSALIHAEKSGDIDQKVEGLCLKSIHCRANNMAMCEAYINQALTIVNDPAVSQLTRAKVYYNAGIFQQDLMNNPEKAAEYYDMASANFDKAQQDFRTYVHLSLAKAKIIMILEEKESGKISSILDAACKDRLKVWEESEEKVLEAASVDSNEEIKKEIENAKDLLKDGKVDSANKAVESLQKSVPSFTSSHEVLLSLQAKITTTSRHIEVYRIASRAMKVAQAKNMEKELEDLKQIISDIEGKVFI